MKITPKERILKAEQKYLLISNKVKSGYGKGAQMVLDVAFNALKWGYRRNKWNLVEIEDLWAHALKEGSALFNTPERLWAPTTPDETFDMLGQTTIGPWQITINNIRKYGLPYGIKKGWPVQRIIQYCRDHPEIQAKIAADYIQNSYELYGSRSPYAIQNYFWLEAFIKGEIGQGKWDAPCLVKQSWKKITPDQKKQTGFYAKQLVLGSKNNPYGLIYWLYITKDFDAIKHLLRTWKNQVKYIWDNRQNKPVATNEPAGFEIHEKDFKYCSQYMPRIKNIIREISKS